MASSSSSSSSSSVAWMPSHGRHQINIGPSLGRAIKTRKLKGSPATTKRSNLPERDFYAFRYNFKPGAIDSTKPASIDVKKNLDNNTQINAEFPSKEMSEVCTYNGTEIPAKEVECIIIYDDETGQYTLEKLDSVVSLQFGGKRPASSPPATPLATNTTKGKAKRARVDDELEQLILQAGDDPIPQRRQEEEEEEGEEIDIPLRIQVSKRAAPPQPQPPQSTKPTNIPLVNKSQLPHSSSISITTKSSSTISKPSTKPPPPPPPKSSKQTKKPKATTAAAAAQPANEEIIEIERPTKKPRISTTTTTPRPTEPPKPQSPVKLSLPGGQSTFVAPPAPKNSKATIPDTTTTTNTTIPITVPPGVSANITMEEVLGEEEDDEEEDWEAVPTAVPAVHDEYDRLEDEIFGQGFDEEEQEQEQEIDVNAFEAELNEQMEEEMMVLGGDEEGEEGEEEEEDDDMDMEDVMQEAAAAGRPISLNRLASGIAAVGESEEEYSSSDSESD